MKKFFSYMKDLVSSSEGTETAETQDCEPCGSGDDTAMTIAPPQCEENTGKQDSKETAEQMSLDGSKLNSEGSKLKPEGSKLNPDAPKFESANTSALLSMQCAEKAADRADAPLELPSPAGDVEACCEDTAVPATATAEDLRTDSSGTDTCSWEPKTKDVKVALTEKGSNNAVNKEAERSAGKQHSTKPDVIHPLHNSWGIWCFMQNRSQDWHENVKHISNFTSVEDFWSLVKHIRSVDSLPIGCDYYIFKANIQPMWEDKANINGGRWLLKIPQSHPNFVNLWNETLLLLVGEGFGAESESICGAVAQVRRGFNKISIWTRDAADRGTCMRIGYRWKSSMKAQAPVHYEAHMEVNRKGGGGGGGGGGRRSKSVYSIN